MNPIMRDIDAKRTFSTAEYYVIKEEINKIVGIDKGFLKARRTFRKFKKDNFLTPDPIDYFMVNGFAVEVSEGSGMPRAGIHMVYGVSVIQVKDGEKDKECEYLSKCCFSLVETLEYIETLKAYEKGKLELKDIPGNKYSDLYEELHVQTV